MQLIDSYINTILLFFAVHAFFYFFHLLFLIKDFLAHFA